jgi:hypothetical protein
MRFESVKKVFNNHVQCKIQRTLLISNPENVPKMGSENFWILG